MCGNYEPWKSEAYADKKTSTLGEAYFPEVFAEKYKAENSARAKAAEEIELLSDPTDEERRTSEECIIKLLRQIRELRARRDNLPEQQQIRELDRVKNELASKSSKVGILDFKRKRQHSAQLYNVISEQAVCYDMLQKKQLQIDRQIMRLQAETIIEAALAYDCTGNVCCVQSENVTTYYIETGEIPERVLRIAESDTETMQISETFASQLDEGLEAAKQQLQAKAEQSHAGENTATVTETTSPLFCRKCGFKLIAESAFCSRCGSKIDG